MKDLYSFDFLNVNQTRKLSSFELLQKGLNCEQFVKMLGEGRDTIDIIAVQLPDDEPIFYLSDCEPQTIKIISETLIRQGLEVSLDDCLDKLDDNTLDAIDSLVSKLNNGTSDVKLIFSNNKLEEKFRDKLVEYTYLSKFSKRIESLLFTNKINITTNFLTSSPFTSKGISSMFYQKFNYVQIILITSQL